MEINPLCVLDFYTYESCQRKGYGKIIFSEMLSKEKIEPKKMGFDRPSPKFLNFLNKYYGLNDYVPQNNNYVVFKDYFIDEPLKKDKYDIYSSNSYSNNNNRNILSQRKLGKFNKGNNENNQQNKSKNEISQKDKDFTSRIYKEYYKSNEKQKKENKEEDNYKYNQKKNYGGYNQYQSSSSEYGAFFHMNK